LRWFALLLKYLSRTLIFPSLDENSDTSSAVCFHVPTGPCPRHGLVSPSGRPPRRGPQPSAVPVGSHSGVACRTCASEVRSTFLRACMRDDRRTDHRLMSSQTLEADGRASRDAVARQSGAGTCRVLISSKFLLKNLAPPGVRPGLVTVRVTVRVHAVADRLFASSCRMCGYFCRQPVKKNFLDNQ